MDIRDLRCLIAIADAGALARAGEVLHVSRQAVAKTLKRAEAQAGARLFERRGAALVPTERGEDLVEGAREVVDAFDRLCAANLCHPGGAPTAAGRVREVLSIALVVGGRVALPPGLVERYSAAYPHVALNIEEMSTEAVLAAVVDGNADIGIVGSHPDLLQGFAFDCIRPVGVWMYLPDTMPLAKRQVLGLDDLDGLPLVSAGAHNHVHRFVMGRCEQAGVQPDLCATATDLVLIGHLTNKYRAACFGFPPDMEPVPPHIVPVRIDLAGADAFGTYLVRRAEKGGRGGSLRPAVRAFWNLARSLCPR